MAGILANLISFLTYVFDRLDWLSLIDLLLVTLVFFSILRLLRDTQAMVLLRGILLLIALISLLTSLEVLPAFSWLMRTTLPALLLAIPVIFVPEIRRALERLGRAGSILETRAGALQDNPEVQRTITAVVNATQRLSERKHGALIVLQRLDSLQEYVRSGVPLNAKVTAELLLQIFYPNTPLHDGAVIISGERLVAAACVLPLSSRGVLSHSPERQMGLRHRAALGISEVSDALTVVVSEENGAVSVVHSGQMTRRVDMDKMESILKTLYHPAPVQKGLERFFSRLWRRRKKEE